MQVGDVQCGHYQQQHLPAGPHHGGTGLQHTVRGKQQQTTPRTSSGRFPKLQLTTTGTSSGRFHKL